MSTYYNPTIVTDGLVLCLDAANRDSYPGTGTTWYDLTDNNVGTLINGPTFNSDKNGSIVFDGTNDYVDMGNKSKYFLLNTSFTLAAWVYLPSHNNKYRVIMSQDRSQSVNTNTYELGISDTNKIYYYNGSVNANSYTVDTNSWLFIVTVATLSGSNINVNIYANCNLINTFTTTAPIDPGTGPFYLGVDAPTGTNQLSFFSGNIALASIYNRALSFSEIQQNFNALRGRFGI